MALYTTMAVKERDGVWTHNELRYLGVIDDGSQYNGHLEYTTDSVFSLNAKFAVEYAHSGYVHIRSCFNNRYWARSSPTGNYIVAQGVEPMEDVKSWSCTLFKIEIDAKNVIKFHHIQSNAVVQRVEGRTRESNLLIIDPKNMNGTVSLAVDYETLVMLPKLVAFKGSNGLYYKNSPVNLGYESNSSFSGDDIGDPHIACVIEHTNHGFIRVMPFISADKPSPWYWTVHSDANGHALVTDNNFIPTTAEFFSVIKVSKNVVALRENLLKKICVRTDYEGQIIQKDRKDRLVGKALGVVTDARLEVVEPLFRRSVNVYEFDLDKSRVYDMELLFSRENIWDNYTDETQSGIANASITTTKSRTYSNSVNVGGSVETTFVTKIPFIAEGKITTSISSSYTHQWDETIEEEQQVGDSFTATVLPRKTTIARGVALKGRCDVPFSYVQRDFPTNGDPPVSTTLHDGVFTGANAYSFRTEVRYEDLPPHKGPADQAPTTCIMRTVPPSN